MTIHDNQRKKYLIDIICSYAPTNVDEHKLANSLSGSDVRDLAGTLYDGLAYGNWPWVVYMMGGNKFQKE